MRSLYLSTPVTRLLILLAVLTGALGISALVGCGGSDNSSSSGGLPGSRATLTQVQQGRYIVTSFGCTDCHSGGNDNPASSNWMAGYITGSTQGTFAIGPFTTYAANLTPDTTTGLGNVTDRQVFNALRFGLVPSLAPDAVITSTTPGVGNFPAAPHYLAPPMPWPAIRHMTDSDLWSIIAYLKHGIKPVANAVPEDKGPGGLSAPTDFWASEYTDAVVGPSPGSFPGYPAANEQFTP